VVEGATESGEVACGAVKENLGILIKNSVEESIFAFLSKTGRFFCAFRELG